MQLVKAETSVKTSTSKSGSVKTTYLDRKTYGIQNKLTGAALNRKHLEYRREMGIEMNASLASAMTRGELVAQSAQKLTSGLIKVTFAPANKVGGSPVPSREAALSALGLTDEQVLALLSKETPAAPAKA